MIPKNTTEQMKLSQKEESKRLAHENCLFTLRWDGRLKRREAEDKKNGHYQ